MASEYAYRSSEPVIGVKTSAGSMAQGAAVMKKNIIEQRRQWVGHLLVLLSPFIFCGMMVGLQFMVNRAIDSSGAFQCGCQCLECCYYSDGDDFTKEPPCYRHDEDGRHASGRRACRPSDACREYNTSNCGLAFSSSHEAFYCDIPHPTVWPPVIQMPETSGGEGPDDNSKTKTGTAGISQQQTLAGDDEDGRIGDVDDDRSSFDDAAEVSHPEVPDEDFAIIFHCNGGIYEGQQSCSKLGVNLLGGSVAIPATAYLGREVDSLLQLLLPSTTSADEQGLAQHPNTASNETEPSDVEAEIGDDSAEERMRDVLRLLDEDPMLLARTQELTRPSFFLATRASTLAAYYTEPAFVQLSPTTGRSHQEQTETAQSMSQDGSGNSPKLYGLSLDCAAATLLGSGRGTTDVPALMTIVPTNVTETLASDSHLEASSQPFTGFEYAAEPGLSAVAEAPSNDSTSRAAWNTAEPTHSPDDVDQAAQYGIASADLGAQSVLGVSGLLSPAAGLSLLPPDAEIAMGAARERCFTTQLVQVDSPADLTRALECGEGLDTLDCPTTAEESGRPVAGFDFRDSRLDADGATLDVAIWWNSSNTGANALGMGLLPPFGPSSAGSDGAAADFAAVIPNHRIPGLMNMATNAFVKTALGGEHEILLLGTREMPKAKTGAIHLDFNLLTGPLFFSWALQMLLPEMLRHIVQEKESRSVDMMKMHGLGPATYWGVQFLWDFVSHCRYLIVFSTAGHISGLSIFTCNGYGLQAAFYLLFSATQVAWAMLVSRLFTRAKTASAAGSLWVILTGAIAGFVMPYLLTTEGLGADVLVGVLQLLPPFALYSGLFELSQHSFVAGYAGTAGLTIRQMLTEPGNRLPGVLLTLAIEAPVFLLLPAAVSLLRNAMRCCLGWSQTVSVIESPGRSGTCDDVGAEHELSGRLVKASNAQDASPAGQQPPAVHGVVVHELRKVYHGGIGTRPKVACHSLSLCLRHGECFGLLGPNGAGKTSALHMMVGLSKKTSGCIRVAGFDAERDMASVHHSIGVCLQHDCLWESLTAREHLRFYCSLRHSMSREELDKEAVESLTMVDLQDHSERLVGGFSGGMKRRLSLAIALMGSPRVIYLDEPTTGIDPASRNIVWRAIQKAKLSCTMILTTHSMEEAQALCDRLGIFVAGRLECIGTTAELKRRFANHMVLTVMVATTTEGAAKSHSALDAFLRERFPEAELCFALGGTCKFKLPANVAVSQLFKAIRSLRSVMQVLDWGINGATLEEVFINVASSEGPAGGAEQNGNNRADALEPGLGGPARLGPEHPGPSPREPLPVSQGTPSASDEPDSPTIHDRV